MCWLAFVRVRAVGRDNIDPRQSYIFVANHQGAYDIFTIYGWLGHQFRWMMKKELRRIPLVGYACERIQQIYVIVPLRRLCATLWSVPRGCSDRGCR